MALTFEEKFIRTRLKLCLEFPFFGTLLLNSSYKITDEVPIAATDGHVMLFNEEAMLGQTQGDFKGIVIHEVLHMALEHVERMEDLFKRDPIVANIACDIVVNGIIDDNGGGSISLPKGAVRDNSLKHLSVREIYSILKKKQKDDPDYFKEKLGVDPDSGDGVNECLKVPSGGGGEDEDKSEGNDSGPSSRAKSAYWKDVLNKAATIAKSHKAGIRGAGLERIFKELLQPSINWRDVLYKYVTDAKTDFEGFDRRFVHSGLYLDDLDGCKIDVLVFIDTSGSVDEELLGEFLGELKFAINSLPQVTGELWYFDTKLYPRGDIMEIFDTPKLKGGGGTSFVPALKKAISHTEENGLSQTLAIIFTDGYADLRPSAIPEPDSPLLWCISPGGVKNSDIPFGECVRILK